MDSSSSSSDGTGSVGVALALVFGAGLSTAFGAAIVCTPGLAKYATPKFLAGGLAFSAGVMMYVSFVEIFQKAVGSFGDAGHSENAANLYATLCFFGGVALMIVSWTCVCGDFFPAVLGASF